VSERLPTHRRFGLRCQSPELDDFEPDDFEPDDFEPDDSEPDDFELDDSELDDVDAAAASFVPPEPLSLDPLEDSPDDVVPDDFLPRLSVLKKPEPLNVTPTGVKTFLTGRTLPVSGWAISVRLSS
jgi:hypothetical protein